jgi:hypothetical protein
MNRRTFIGRTLAAAAALSIVEDVFAAATVCEPRITLDEPPEANERATVELVVDDGRVVQFHDLPMTRGPYGATTPGLLLWTMPDVKLEAGERIVVRSLRAVVQAGESIGRRVVALPCAYLPQVLNAGDTLTCTGLRIVVRP